MEAMKWSTFPSLNAASILYPWTSSTFIYMTRGGLINKKWARGADMVQFQISVEIRFRGTFLVKDVAHPGSSRCLLRSIVPTRHR